jgi:hypothetical protein
VTEITPTYYAAGEYQHRYNLKGNNFNILPADAVAVPMIANDNPLQYRNIADASNMMQMTRLSDTEVIFAATATAEHLTGSIGAILSNDRVTIYWVNETNPLP